jgi:hypothetical protein
LLNRFEVKITPPRQFVNIFFTFFIYELYQVDVGPKAPVSTKNCSRLAGEQKSALISASPRL